MKTGADELLQIIAILGIISAVVYGVLRYVQDFIQSKAKKRENYLKTFETLVSQLTSDNRTSQISSAILLRRYFDSTNNKGNIDLKIETINVISSLLKILPTGVFQKTLADGLAYAEDLSNCDLQKTNLQDVYLGKKNNNQIQMNSTDLFLADLSYALIENITAHKIVFYRSILFNTRIKNCDFTEANFVGADLTNISFKKVVLKNADFTDAKNIPDEILKDLDNGIYRGNNPVTTNNNKNNKPIFFSMPGTMTKEDEILTKDFKIALEEIGYNVTYYNRDTYPNYGQFNRVREAILNSSAIVAFGLKQLNIHKASYRPGTQESENWEDKWLSTPWNEIEVGMGLMKGMPILLVVDPDIHDGIFDENLNECFVSRIPTTVDSRTLEQNKSFMEWLSKI